MGPRKEKKISAYQHQKQQGKGKGVMPSKAKPKLRKAGKSKKKRNAKAAKDKKLIVDETQSDNVTIVSLRKGSPLKTEVIQDLLDLKQKKNKIRSDVGKTVRGTKLKKAEHKKMEVKRDTEFVVVTDDSKAMLVEAQAGSCSKDKQPDGNMNNLSCTGSMHETFTVPDKGKKRKTKKRKYDRKVLDSNNSIETVSETAYSGVGSRVGQDQNRGLNSKESLNQGEKQRNPPRFESAFVKKKYDKNLEKEIGLDKGQVETQRKMLTEMTELGEKDTETVQFGDANIGDEGHQHNLETDLVSENDEVSDLDSENASEEDIMDSLEQQEALFKVFGHDQVDLGSCGVFGSGSTSFQFHGQETSPETDSRYSELNDSGFSNDMVHRRIQDEGNTEGKNRKMQDGRCQSKKGRKQKTKTVTGGVDGSEISVTNKEETRERETNAKCISLPLPKEEAALVVLAHPQELCIQGKAVFTMVTGEMDIMGHRLKLDKSYNVYSPLSNSYAVLKTIGGHVKFNKLSEKLSDLGFHEPDASLCDELKAFQSTHCVSFVVRPLDSEAHGYISSMSPYNGLFSIRSDEPLAHNNQLLPLGLGLFPREYVARPWITLSKDIRQILDLWEDMLTRGDKSASGRAPVVLVCGGKNSGKSTLNRHLINSALKSLKEVSYLELDVGQTEFSPPGCVSLYHVSEPVLGPPFTHLRKAEKMCYYGGVTAGVNVSLYTKCVAYVVAAYKGDNPLIVNTMGWNKGLGIKLLVDILHIVNPDIVVQISTYKSTDNFPPITPQFKMEEEGWLYNRQDQIQEQENEMSADGHELCMVQTPVRKMQEKFITWTAADHRNVTLLSYFCDGLKSGQTLLSIAPYTVPWTSLSVHICNAAGIQPSQTLLVLNGSVVGLCQSDLPEKAAADNHYPRLLSTFPMCQCLGFGLVRGIDPETKLLYIVTPMTLGDLVKVNVLVKGSLMLPEQVSKQQRTSQQKPYWDSLTPSLGSWKTTYKDRKMRRPGAVFRSRHQ